MKFDRLPNQPEAAGKSGSDKNDNTTFLKQALLLATALFLMTAPAPDSHDIAEIAADFITKVSVSHPSSFRPN